MKKNYDEMGLVELRKEKAKVLKSRKVLKVAGSVAICVGIAGMFLSLPVAARKHAPQREIRARQEYTYEEYATKTVEDQKQELRNQVKNGELSFEEYDEQVAQIKKPSEADYFNTWSEEDREEYNKIQNTALAQSMATLFGSGIATFGLMFAKLEGDDRLRRKAQNLEELTFQKSYRSSFEKSMANPYSPKNNIEL